MSTMEGLIWKDIRMLAFYCRRYLLIALPISVIFFLTGQESIAMVYHVIVVSGMITTLMSYDEKSGWNQYCGTLPCKAGQLVGAKYIMLLLLQVVLLGILAAALVGKNLYTGRPSFEGSGIFPLLFGMSVGMMSLILPFLFRLGIEKGRMAYYLVFLVSCALSGALVMVSQEVKVPTGGILGVGLVVLYLGSWYVSTRWYESKEEK